MKTPQVPALGGMTPLGLPGNELPSTWVWMHKAKGLYGARDSRWEARVPDLVSTSKSDVIRQALECDKVTSFWGVRRP